MFVDVRRCWCILRVCYTITREYNKIPDEMIKINNILTTF